MNELLEIVPREVFETLPEAQVEFRQTLDAGPREQGRCLITLPKVTFPADC